MSIPMRKGINKWRLGTSLPNELGEKTYETRSAVKLATSTGQGAGGQSSPPVWDFVIPRSQAILRHYSWKCSLMAHR